MRYNPLMKKTIRLNPKEAKILKMCKAIEKESGLTKSDFSELHIKVIRSIILTSMIEGIKLAEEIFSE